MLRGHGETYGRHLSSNRERTTYRETFSQVSFNLWSGTLLKADIIACNEAMFLRVLHSWGGKR